MDPVAQQFLQQLDDAGDELPDPVRSGLLMCGSDAVPGLVARLDPERPEAVQRHAADLLGRLRDPDAIPPLVQAFARGPASPAITRAVGDAIRGYGAAALESILAAAADPEHSAPARLTLLSLPLAGGSKDPRVERLVGEIAPDYPPLALQLMASWPRAHWLKVIAAHRDLFRAVDPAKTGEVSMACLPLVKEASEARLAEVQQVLSQQADYAAKIAARAAAAAAADPAGESEG